MPFLESDQRFLQQVKGEVPTFPSPHDEVYSYITDALHRKQRYTEARMKSRIDEVTFLLGRGIEYTVYEKEDHGRRALQVWRGREGSSTREPISVVLIDVYSHTESAMVVSHTTGRGKDRKTETVRGVDNGIDVSKADVRAALPEIFPRPKRTAEEALLRPSSVNPTGVFPR